LSAARLRRLNPWQFPRIAVIENGSRGNAKMTVIKEDQT
jgi:hypothetical protein